MLLPFNSKMKTRRFGSWLWSRPQVTYVSWVGHKGLIPSQSKSQSRSTNSIAPSNGPKRVGSTFAWGWEHSQLPKRCVFVLELKRCMKPKTVATQLIFQIQILDSRNILGSNHGQLYKTSRHTRSLHGSSPKCQGFFVNCVSRLAHWCQ